MVMIDLSIKIKCHTFKYISVATIIGLIILISSCTNRQITNNYNNPVISFFSHYVCDMQNATKIIIKYELISNLTHLLIMDNGGNKYYLLEHEHITEMLNNVTHKLYDDLIITNNIYQVVYSMQNKNYYGRRIFDISPLLQQCLMKCNYKDISIYEPSEYPVMSGNFSFCVVYPITSNERNKGFLIGFINQIKLYDVLPEDAIIVDKYGMVIIKPEKSIVNTIPIPDLQNNYGTFEQKQYSIMEVKYKNIEWYLLSP